MFKIGDFSKLAQVSVKTLRYYAQLGLLEPVWVDRFSGYRYYTLEQLPRLNRILALKDLGFSLEQIQQMLREDLAASELRGMLRLKQAELERQLQDEQMRLKRIQARMRQIDQEGRLPAYDVVLKQIAPQWVAGLREVVADIYQVQSLFARLHSALEMQGNGLDVTHAPLAAPLADHTMTPITTNGKSMSKPRGRSPGTWRFPRACRRAKAWSCTNCRRWRAWRVRSIRAVWMGWRMPAGRC